MPPSPADNNVPPPPLIPIVIGVTGKRDLGSKEKGDHVRKRLLKEFSNLEKTFPNTPLVLATGLTRGAGLLAAEVALNQPGQRWTVVGILPFEEKLLLEDLAADTDPGWHQSLKNVLAFRDNRNRPLLLKVLKPLRKPLGNSGDASRGQHYEQVDLVIADWCGLLIAVTPKEEKPAKGGATACVLRLRPRFSEGALKVVEASEEIALADPLDREMKGLVLVLDPDPHQPKDDDAEDDPRYAWMTLERIEAFNQRSREPPAASEQPSAAKLFEATSAVQYLDSLRRKLSDIQGPAKRWLSRSLWGLTTLFIASVAILEVYAKVEVRWLFAGYLIALFCGLGLVFWVRKNELSAFTEDYRGAAEAMRVQVEWWRLGLRGPTHRVDRHYFVGGEGHFAVLRSGIKAVIDAAVLLSTKPAPQAQPLELEPEKKGLDPRRFWIPGQLKYFAETSETRHRTAIRWSSLAWYLFQLSVGVVLALGGLLALLEWGPHYPGAQAWLFAHVSEYRQWLLFGPFPVAAAWAFFFLMWVRTPELRPRPRGAKWWQQLSRWFRYRSILGTRGRHSGKRGWWVAVPLGALMVPAVLAYSQAILGDKTLELKALLLAEKISIVLMIVLAAASGAVRFVLERRALEAEAISYRETLQRFIAARDHALKACSQPGASADTILTAHRKLGFELGRIALAENEAWLRAHRQRPFESIP